jgi:V8-like Glu-specific endopeptidase
MHEVRAGRPIWFRILGTTTLAALIGSLASAQKTLPAPAPGPEVVGSSMAIQLAPDLLQSFESGTGRIWGDLIAVRSASFVKAHFVDVNLRAGDVLTLRSKTGTVVEEIRGRGPKDLGTFWALSAFGDELELLFRFSSSYEKPPFRIDMVIVGDPAMVEPLSTLAPESVCSPENFDDVFCYQNDAGKWSNVLASVGVMSVGGNPITALFCSGSNVSAQNYVLTNQHCITSQGSCDSSEFVFKFYRQGCNTGAAVTADWQSFRCDDVVATSPFNSCDQGLGDLDYSLCSVIGDPASTFGYVTPDPVPLTDGEAIYIVQHPAGRPHEIAHGSGPNVDVDGTVLRYYDTLDTEGGSSGSPIFRESDDKLIGLHHCGGCATSGVGNRGMLMSDIYPNIQSFLCSATVELGGTEPLALTQVHGDGDVVLEPGETWQFTPRVLNRACSAMALGVVADVVPSAGSSAFVTMLSGTSSFGDVAGGATAAALAPARFRVRKTVPCGSEITFDLVNLMAANGGPYPEALGILSKPIGEAPITTVHYSDFSSTAGWTAIDGGTGTGTAQTWTASNPGGRSLPLGAPFFIADSDRLGSGAQMDEQLVGPVIDCSGFAAVELQFSHDFRWWSGGMDEQCDVDIRSSATGGAWVNIAKYQDANASGTVVLDVSTQAAGQDDVQIRFHYYDAVYEWWWAVDDVFLLGNNGYDCEVFGPNLVLEPLGSIPKPPNGRP